MEKEANKAKVMEILRRQQGAPTLQIVALSGLGFDQTREALQELEKEGKVKFLDKAAGDDLSREVVILKYSRPLRFGDLLVGFFMITVVVALLITLFFSSLRK